MAQHFISEHGEALSGVVLAGSNGKPAPLIVAVRIIAHIERLRLGLRGRSALVHSLAFGIFNKQFEPVRTEADWLSRDSAEVDKYIADPLCRFRPALQLWIDLLDALGEIAKPARQKRNPKQLPIYVIAGTRDPVSAYSKGLEQLLSAYTPPVFNASHAASSWMRRLATGITQAVAVHSRRGAVLGPEAHIAYGERAIEAANDGASSKAPYRPIVLVPPLAPMGAMPSE